MLTISAEQMKTMDDVAMRRFANELRPALEASYPHCFAGFQLSVREKMVRNMLGRASHWGITWQTAFLAFAEMMLSVAPNFDEHHDIQVLLGLKWLDANRAMLCVNPQETRKSLKAARLPVQDLPLFIPPELIGAPQPDQTAAAISLTLGDRVDGADPRDVAAASLSMAKSLNLDSVPDSGLVVAAWRLLYGRDFRDGKAFPWLADVFDTWREPAHVVNMLKLRIGLDHGRFV